MTGPAPATRVVLRPLATPLPLGFLALALVTSVLAAVQLGWVPVSGSRTAALVALAATVPLQLIACVLGFATRDPAAATGMGVLAGTWATIGAGLLGAPPGSTNPALGVLLVTSGVAMLVPTASAAAKPVAALVMGTAAARFAVTGVYELTGSAGWKTAAGVVGLVLGAVAVYAALALDLEGVLGRAVLPIGRHGPAKAAVEGKGPLDPRELASEPGVRPQL